MRIPSSHSTGLRPLPLGGAVAPAKGLETVARSRKKKASTP